MSKITGTKTAVEAVARLDHERALSACEYGPWSQIVGNKRVNCCPACESPMPGAWECKCGWDHSQGYAMSRRCVCGGNVPTPVLDKDGKETGDYEAPISEALAEEAQTAKGKQASKRSPKEKALAAVEVADKKPTNGEISAGGAGRER